MFVSDDLERRARLHAALGEPTRLAIVEELTTSDRSPNELGRLLDLPTNLLAHHLDVLEDVGLIRRFTSAGDRRRRYVGLERGPLAELGLRRPTRNGRMLFVCSQTSARSQLAAARWTSRTGGDATSAGTRPADRVHPGAVAAARRAGLDLDDAVPRRLEADSVGRDDVVVTVCDRAHEELDVDPAWLHWSIPDPVGAGTNAAFDDTIADLGQRIAALAPDHRTTPDPTTPDPTITTP